MSSETIHINVHHVTRIEGHGNIVVDIEKGAIQKVEWQVPEAPRFFEAMLVGRSFSEVAKITSRICGICSIGHTFASLKATEAALGIPVSAQALRLREILLHAENLQSHLLHVCYLVVPDLLKVDSVIPLIWSHRELVLLVTRLHRLANETCDGIGGRTTHPIRARLGGWTLWPSKDTLAALKRRHEAALEDLKKLVALFKSLAGRFPAFERSTEYVSLTHPGEYALYDGRIRSSDTPSWIPVEEYERVTNEYVSPQSTAKWTRFHRDSYAVGALARYHNNREQLTSLCKEVAGELGLDGGRSNPFLNSAAQVVECAFSTEKIVEHLDRLLASDEEGEPEPKIVPRAGRGIGAVEVPRGVLFHDYTYDEEGTCVRANCIIPTNQNLANIQKDLEKVVAEYKDRGKSELQFIMEMLVRAYDPCISCSTHFLNIRFL